MRLWELSLSLIKCRIGEISILLVNANKQITTTKNQKNTVDDVK